MVRGEKGILFIFFFFPFLDDLHVMCVWTDAVSDTSQDLKEEDSAVGRTGDIWVELRT
jgi:hypothetical protein